jgi:hypothetical protein
MSFKYLAFRVNDFELELELNLIRLSQRGPFIGSILL